MADDERSQWETLHVLSAAVTAATRQVETDSRLNEARIKASVNKMRWYRRAAVLGLVAAVVAGIVGYSGLQLAQDLRAQRNEARIVACQKDNDVAAKVNGLGSAMSNIIALATPPNPNRTPQQQSQVDQFAANANAALDNAHVGMRDCSPAAIARYYQRGK